MEQVGRGVELVGRTGQALDLIMERVILIDDHVAQIAGSAQEQALALGEVNAAMNEMDQAVQQNAAMVDSSTAATRALGRETSALTQAIAFFRTTADRTPAARAA